MLFGSRLKREMIDPGKALQGRPERPYRVPATHAVLGTPLAGPWPEGTEVLYVATGCFWGTEEIFWQIPGVVTTAVGYMGGFTPNPTYEETCTGMTGHTEATLVAYDPSKVSAAELLKVFWETHDPTQGFRQGNDMGTQYRSAFYWTTDAQREAYERSRDAYAPELKKIGYGDITTEARPATEAGEFFYAEEPHQQYLHKVPYGYRCHSSTGVNLPATV